MKIEIGQNVKQTEGFTAFVPRPFPPKGLLELSQAILIKAAEADRLIGKLDGITHTLPDVDFFLSMFVAKDAASSSQIEGTKASMADAIEMNAGVTVKKTDADDILFYIKALNYGVERLKDFPLSLRLIREIHAQLMTDARATHFADPGEFRKSQNWIGGTTPNNASFVPPTVSEMNRALNDLEKFLHNEKLALPLIHAALTHAQFETIHPFLDGNGRAGRLLITMLLCHRNMLERPVLFLSSYFKKHQKIYYQKLHDYHFGEVESWIDFFLDGVIETANDSISVSKQITKLRENDMAKIQSLAKRESASGVLVLRKLYAQPIVSSKTIMEWTKFSRVGSQKLIDRFMNLDILELKDAKETYDRAFVYRKYIDIFMK
ncbi:MAG: Filamentation induced by cAMP protein Fic [Candidatus Magasanikbacteria bacterium GW2011_GWA2_56_11]|uniref:Filamentation induced by cAMP protein Fic n=1 Tax=Candidatus Magasanikbacteria bacterium GW2011_GWA2_56_11 TaxID=1619044 RepID=A0A0G1YE05_9BACT|nr:MAG: Filamentation induced by cAMP protein Fic [Candidatus Magasanikbacteria bacterium GW2011_GWA2_56_11]